MSNAVILYTTFPSKDDALSAANILVTERLAACANIIDGMSSVYIWENKLESSQEFIMILKVLPERTEQCKAKLNEIHPYDTPCILQIECTASEQFLSFMRS